MFNPLRAEGSQKASVICVEVLLERIYDADIDTDAADLDVHKDD